MVTMVVPYAAGGHCWPFDLKQYHDPSDVQDKTLCQIGTTLLRVIVVKHTKE